MVEVTITAPPPVEPEVTFTITGLSGFEAECLSNLLTRNTGAVIDGLIRRHGGDHLYVKNMKDILAKFAL